MGLLQDPGGGFPKPDVSRVQSVPAGKVIHSMVAHLDAVTSLAVDPNGIYLMSGSKSCNSTGPPATLCTHIYVSYIHKADRQ